MNFGLTVLNFSGTVKIIATSGSSITVCPISFIYNETSQKCYCDDGYIEINNVCVACEAIGNSTANADPTNSRRCICKPTYVWSDTLRGCYCSAVQSIVDLKGLCFNCSTLLNNGTGNASSISACKCKNTFVFDPESNTCKCPDVKFYIFDNKCFGCTGFPNGTGNVNSTGKSCECKATYTLQTNACLCPTGNYLSLTKTCVQCLNAACKCSPGKIFKPATGNCGCPVDKSVYTNSVCIPCNSENMTG